MYCVAEWEAIKELQHRHWSSVTTEISSSKHRKKEKISQNNCYRKKKKMPKSFLIKRAQKVNTGFFPWNSKTLVQGCCLEYKMKNKEERIDEITDLEIEEKSDERARNCSPTPSSSEIRILTPYDTPMSPPRLIISSCCDNDEEHYSYAGHTDDEVIIPSPLGYSHEIKSEEKVSSYQTPYHPSSYYGQHSTAATTKLLTTPVPMKYLQQWSVGSIEELKKHQCEYCLKWFQRSSSLSNHRLIHKNAKTFKCTQCNMSFLRKSDLGKHMVTHSGSKPYQCNVCGKRFSQSSNMLTHQRRHTGVRPYSCGVCGKSFYRKVDVRRHASVHREF